MKRVAIVMGSDTDLPVVQKTMDTLDALGVSYEARVYSAHRTPGQAAAFAQGAAQNGFGVIVAAAGMAAHLAGVLAAHTVLPVIGIPCKGGIGDGLDALLATVQMPAGIPVATVAVNGGVNAAVLAAQILALGDEALKGRLVQYKEDMAQGVLEKDRKLQEIIHAKNPADTEREG